MPVIYSKLPTAFNNDIVAVDASGLYDGITATVESAGWGGSSLITGGKEYVIQSPQELEDGSHLKARVRIWVETTDVITSGVPVVVVAFAGYEPGSDAGMLHWLQVTESATWVCWANTCSLAIGRLGLGRDYPDPFPGGQPGGNSFFGGIPYVQGDFTGCGMDRSGFTVLTDTWFTCGDVWHEATQAGYRQSLRNSVTTDYKASSSSINGIALTPAIASSLAYGTYAVPAILTFVPGQVTNTVTTTARLRWWNTSDTVANPVYYPPMVGWGTALDVYPRIRGILFDALFASVAQDIDAILPLIDEDDGNSQRTYYNYTFDKDSARDGQDVDCPNATGGIRNFYGSLLLLVTPPEGNVAY